MQKTEPRSRQAFQHPRTSLGSVGHWFNIAGLIAPLVIGELIKDPDAKFRAIRISSIITAAASGMFWREHVKRKRELERQDREHRPLD